MICSILVRMMNPIQYSSDRRLFEEQIFPNLEKTYNLSDVEIKGAFISHMGDIVNIGALFVFREY